MHPKISSNWYALHPQEDQLDADLYPLRELSSISLSLDRRFCGFCDDVSYIDNKRLQSTPFWRICRFIERTKIQLKGLSLAWHAHDSSLQILPQLVESFPSLHLYLEELTLTALTLSPGAENSGIETAYRFIQSCQRLRRLRFGIPLLYFPPDIFWGGLSYLQLRVHRVRLQDVEGFEAFVLRHKNLKRLLLRVEELGNDGGEGKEGEENLIKKIKDILQGTDHHFSIVDSGDEFKWI